MTEKERIEELTRDIIETQHFFDAKNYYRFENIAKALIEKGYTKNKIPEDSVVLSKEEYEALDNARKEVEKFSNQYPFRRSVDGFNSIICSLDFENYYNLIDDIAKSEVEKSRKETAKEFADIVYKTLTDKQVWNAKHNWWLQNGECFELKDLLKQILKQQYEVEE